MAAKQSAEAAGMLNPAATAAYAGTQGLADYFAVRFATSAKTL
jgi:hypothetical protein